MSERDFHKTTDKTTLTEGELVEEIMFHFKSSYVSDGNQVKHSRIGNRYYSELLKRAENTGNRESIELFNSRFKTEIVINIK